MLAALEAEEVMDEVKGGMNDSAKRRLSWPADADHGFELVAPSSSNLSQAPVTPKKLGYGKEAASAGPPTGSLPRGIASAVEWGQTVCTLPKFKDQKYHYSELLAKAEKNKEISDYLSWIYHAGVKSAKVDDLRNYMKYMNFNPDDSSASITYPGTSIPREF